MPEVLTIPAREIRPADCVDEVRSIMNVTFHHPNGDRDNPSPIVAVVGRCVLRCGDPFGDGTTCWLDPEYSAVEEMVLASTITVVRGMHPEVVGCRGLHDCERATA